MHLLKCLFISVILLNYTALCSDQKIDEVVEVKGVLDTNKKSLLKTYENLSLYGIRPTERDKNSQYFDAYSSLIISSKVINPNVKSLRLQFCGLEDDNILRIGDLKKLRKLELPANGISDRGMEYITQLSQLEVLDLSSNKLTDKGVEIIATKLLNLKTLNLSLNKRITDAGIDFLKENKILENLSIEFTGVTYRKYEAEISKWENLKTLKYYPSPDDPTIKF
ncbi:MAG: hypothetical protein JNK42_02705 [Caedimonas sp.]|nr:hypothetical protein [Caedimonas sp.]